MIFVRKKKQKFNSILRKIKTKHTRRNIHACQKKTSLDPVQDTVILTKGQKFLDSNPEITLVSCALINYSNELINLLISVTTSLLFQCNKSRNKLLNQKGS